MRRHGGAFLAAVFAVLAWPGTAPAGMLTRTDSAITYVGSSSAERLTVTFEQGAIVLRNDEPFTTTSCVDNGPDGTQYAATCQASPRLSLSMGAGADVVDNQSIARADIDGGADGDTLKAGSHADSLVGGEGDDQLYPGGSGDGAADDVRGGAGSDTVHYDLYSQPVKVTLDDLADDGAGTESDNVHSDVENVATGAGSDQVSGSAANNRIDAGAGDDVIDGAGGSDTLVGGEGRDDVRAADFVADIVDCGADADTAALDGLDSQTSCETFTVSDADRDGSVAPADCDDADAAVHPGAADTAGNGVDEDCDGADASPPRAALSVVSAKVIARWLAGARTRVRLLQVKPIVAGTSVVLRCTGRGCPFKRRTLTPKAGASADLTRLFKKRKLRPGTLIEVRVLRPGLIGRVVRYRIRRSKRPAAQTMCLVPGAAAPGACP